mgnify:FL=1
METTPINISLTTVGDQFGRFCKKLSEPGGSQVWKEFLELLNDPAPTQYPPITLESTEIVTPNIKVNGFTLPFYDYSKDRLIRKVRGLGIKIDEWAKDLIDSDEFVIDRSKKDCKLVELTGADFDYTEKVGLLAPFLKAKIMGLKQCPHETALQYCFNKGANISGETLFFGAQGLEIKKRKDTRLHILRLENGKLSAVRIAQDRFFLPTDKILFEQA